MPDKVLLVVIDAATPHVVCPAIRTGRLPVMQRLVDAGAMHERSASIFPSITPAATTSIITGAYPAEHGIAGASWFDEGEKQIAYYGDDFWVIARQGFGEFINDFLVRLNGDRLTAPTLFEIIERAGRTAACLNYLVFRGNVPHKVNIPRLLRMLPGVAATEIVEGPTMLHLGDFVGAKTRHGHKLREKGGLLHRFGMDDASTGQMLRDLTSARDMPDFTVAYFADNDYRSHEIGPYAALTVIERLDEILGEAFEAAGGLDRFLRDTWVVITSDHGHCDLLADRKRAVIWLNEDLAEFQQAELGKRWRPKDQIMICPNMRAAQIYLQHHDASIIERLAYLALRNPRVDQVVWRAEKTQRGADGYVVVTSRGRLTFARASTGARDDFGAFWSWSGDPAALDVEQDGDALCFGQYPNAFERLANTLDLHKSGDLWVTAKPGCEFEVPGGKAHVGGASHGALHALDSNSPLIVAGPSRMQLPRRMRSVDIAPLCMHMLGIPMRYGVGDPRGARASSRERVRVRSGAAS